MFSECYFLDVLWQFSGKLSIKYLFRFIAFETFNHSLNDITHNVIGQDIFTKKQEARARSEKTSCTPLLGAATSHAEAGPSPRADEGESLQAKTAVLCQVICS